MKVKIHPLFIVFICISIFFGNVHLVVSYLLVLLIHEFGHAMVAKKYNNELSSLCFMPFGAAMNLKKEFMSPKQELYVAIAGPLLNLICALSIVVLWWFFPSIYTFTFYFCFASFVTAIYNFLPLLPLDGSRIVLALFSMRRKRGKAYKVLRILTIGVGVVFIILFIISAFYTINYNLALIGLFTIIGVLDSTEYIYTKNYLTKFESKDVLKTKFFTVKKGFKLTDVYKYLSSEYYLVLIVLNDDNKPIKTIYESEIVKYLVEQKC